MRRRYGKAAGIAGAVKQLLIKGQVLIAVTLSLCAASGTAYYFAVSGINRYGVYVVLNKGKDRDFVL